MGFQIKTDPESIKAAWEFGRDDAGNVTVRSRKRMTPEELVQYEATAEKIREKMKAEIPDGVPSQAPAGLTFSLL